jgi:hypothetical protein
VANLEPLQQEARGLKVIEVIGRLTGGEIDVLLRFQGFPG